MVLNLLLIGLAIALDPLPLTAFMVVLPSKRGLGKGAAFVFGWLVSLAIVVTVTVLATGNNPPKPSSAPSLASLAVRIAVGAGLVAIGIRQRRRKGQPRTWLPCRTRRRGIRDRGGGRSAAQARPLPVSWLSRRM